MTKGKQAKLTKGDVRSALDRVLDHAESHGEVYEGAKDDHATLRQAFPKADDDGDDEGANPAPTDDDGDDDDK